MKFLLGRFLVLQIAMLSLMSASSARAEAPMDQEFKVISEARYLGAFKLGSDRKLVPVQTPLGGEPTPWFQAELSDGWWTNLGATATVNPNPPALPRAFNEFVSHGQGITAGATVTGFTVNWVSGTNDIDLRSSFVEMLVSFYDGRDTTSTPKAPVQQFELRFEFLEVDPIDGTDQRALSGWTADILLDPEDYFTLPSADFEYGLKFLASEGSINFGPFLHQNIADQTFGLEADAQVGKTYCVFERWAAPAPPTDDYGQFNLVSGTHNGGPFWFGNAAPTPPNPPAPWAAANFTVFYAPAPSATVDAAYVVHNGYTGAGSPNDSGKVLHKETTTPTELTYSNLINSSRGINGIGFDISGTGNAAAITASDFVFEMCELPFASGNPTWIPAPAPATVVVTPGTPDQIVVSWNNNEIANRWLKVTVVGNSNTGLGADEVYYIGHLLGEAGPASPTYTVAFADITPIRSAVGGTVTSESTVDIDKNGTVSFADISAMRANIGTQLGNLTVPPPAP